MAMAAHQRGEGRPPIAIGTKGDKIGVVQPVHQGIIATIAKQVPMLSIAKAQLPKHRGFCSQGVLRQVGAQLSSAAH